LPVSPTPLRQIVSAFVTLALALALWAFIEWRSAPPPPPKVTLPAR
jgi:hypothetical protein